MPGFRHMDKQSNPITPEELFDIQKTGQQPEFNLASSRNISELTSKKVPHHLQIGPKDKSIVELPADKLQAIMQLEYLNEHQAALVVGCSVSKLRSDRHLSKGIPYRKNGRSVRYARSDIEFYMRQNKIDPNL